MNKFWRTIFIIIVLAIPLSACQNLITGELKPVLLETELNYGPPEFRAGYNHGCTTALSAYGTDMMKSTYQQRKAPYYEDNRMYQQVWKDAYAYCYMWMTVYIREGGLL